MFLKEFKSKYTEEEYEWMLLSPKKRFKEASKLWGVYLSLGGSLDPEPDPQSPFYFPEVQGKGAFNRRTGMYSLRRRRV